MAPHVLKRISLIFSLLLISILATAQEKVNGNTASSGLSKKTLNYQTLSSRLVFMK